MDDSVDSIHRVDGYTEGHRVKRSHESERDKERQFARELKDRMEEQKRRQRKNKDEVILDLDSQSDNQPPDDESETKERSGQDAEPTDEAETEHGPIEPGSVDLKA